MALPTMARGFTRDTFVTWCRRIDEGPFSSVSTGERITFRNPELLVTTAAAAALTERVTVLTNIAVAPLHATAVLAKQLATLDVLAGGRLTVGVGVGGREQDYRAAGVPFADRHRRLDAAVSEFRRLWAGEPPFEGADPVGPPPTRPGGPPVLAAALGPRSLARAARWADGVTGFTVTGSGDEVARLNDRARAAWRDAGRREPPRLVNGTFFVLGVPDADEVLRRFAFDYLRVFGDEVARSLADALELSTPGRVHRMLAEAREAGCDEFVLVPGVVDPACLEAAAAVGP